MNWKQHKHFPTIFGVLVVSTILSTLTLSTLMLFPYDTSRLDNETTGSLTEPPKIILLEKTQNQSVILQNACLETHIHANLTTSHRFIALGNYKSLHSIPLMRQFEFPVILEENDNFPLSNRCEFLDGSFALFKRVEVTNFVHWMHELFLLYQQLEATSDPHHWQVFHLPSERKFHSAADLSYLQLVSLLGAERHYSVFGVIQNMSLLHADEVPPDAPETSHCSCFSELVAGKGGGWSGTPLTIPHKASLNRMVQQIAKSLDLNPANLNRKPHCPQPQILFINRPYGEPRHIVNLDSILNRLKSNGIKNIAVADLNAMSFRQQVQLAMQNISILVAPHGQALWLSYFLPETSGIVEILPHGMTYEAFRQIAFSRGIQHYVQYTVPSLPHTNHTVHPRGISHSKSQFVNRYGFSEEKADSIINKMYDVLHNCTDYYAIASFLGTEFGVDKEVAITMAKVFARDQMILAPSVEEITGLIEESVQQMQQSYCN